MNTKHTIAALSLGLAGILGVSAMAGTASAAPRPTVDLATAKAKCEAAIDTRLAEIGKLTTRVSGAKALTADHATTVNGILADAKSGLTDLRAKVEADTDAASLKADCTSVAADYRIFALRAPQVHLAIVGDRQAKIAAKGDKVVAKLEAAIGKAEANGKDVTDEKALLEDMKAKLADASSKLQGLVDTELGYTPADWNANHNVLSPTTTALRTSQSDLKAAFKDATTIVAELKA